MSTGWGACARSPAPTRAVSLVRWPPEAYEPFAGDEVELDAYYARHGWQPQRTILLKPHLGSGRRRRAHAT